MYSSDDPKYKQLIAFIDLVFNMMMAFAFLFILSYVQINPVTENNKKVDPKAEMLLVLTWPDGAYDDLDLWLLLPDGKHISFQSKFSESVNLERDDRGMYGDTTTTTDGRTIQNLTNREVISFRSLVPGTYTANVHYYSAQNEIVFGQKPGSGTAPKPPYKAKVELIRLNPKYEILVTREIDITTPREEHTAFSFTITDKGEIENVNSVEIPFVMQKLQPHSYGGGEAPSLQGEQR